MSTVIKQHKTENYYIIWEIINNCYVVEVCPIYANNFCGYPVCKMVYALSEIDKAQRTFNRYKKKYI